MAVYLVEQLIVGDLPDDARQRAVVDERRPGALAGEHVAVDGVVAGVQLAADEPWEHEVEDKNISF